MKVLIACEESQGVCIEFRKKGHEAYSCDIQKCSGGHPEWHIIVVKRKVVEETVNRWDIQSVNGQPYRFGGRNYQKPRRS